MREIFYNVGHDLLDELATYKNLKLDEKEIDELANILVRYTVGFGLIEVLLQDEKMQDISVNSPAGEIPIFIVHGDYDDCVTNIYPTSTNSLDWGVYTKDKVKNKNIVEIENAIPQELWRNGDETDLEQVDKYIGFDSSSNTIFKHWDGNADNKKLVKYSGNILGYLYNPIEQKYSFFKNGDNKVNLTLDFGNRFLFGDIAFSAKNPIDKIMKNGILKLLQ